MDISTIFLGITLILLAGVAFGLYVVISRLKDVHELNLRNQTDKQVEMLNINVQGMQTRLDQNTNAVNTRLDNAARVISQLMGELGAMKEIGHSLKDFQALLTSPKLRGNLGEQILHDTVSQVIPKDHFEAQFKFKDGQTVDFIIRASDAIIPIDSKFPMENFKMMANATSEADQTMHRREFTKAVKKHVDDIARKYILPHEGTVDFAVMYVPSESVFYEIVVGNDELNDFANSKKILIVSPNSFFYFLKIILMGLERSKIEQEAQRIWELLKALQQDNEKVKETNGLVGRHLTNAKNAFDSAQTEYDKFSGKLDQIKLLK